MEKTLVILKPCTVQRGLIGEIVNRFEKKGLRLAGMKMVWLTDEILSEHYAHLKEKPFFQRTPSQQHTITGHTLIASLIRWKKGFSFRWA